MYVNLFSLGPFVRYYTGSNFLLLSAGKTKYLLSARQRKIANLFIIDRKTTDISSILIFLKPEWNAVMFLTGTLQLLHN